MIRVCQLRREHNGAAARRQVLAGLDLDVAPGELCALLGRSGSGKTTLLQILGGLDSGFSGEVEVAGQRPGELGDTPLAAFRRDRVGFMFQDFHLLPHLAVLDNVLLSCRFDSLATRERLRGRGQQLLARVGLEGREGDHPGQLSGGERQRVALARALLRAPPVLLADEPTGNLDSDTGARLLELLLETAHDDGTSVVVATHDPAVLSAADRGLELREGRLHPLAEAAAIDDEASGGVLV